MGARTQAATLVDLLRSEGATSITIGRTRTTGSVALASAVIDLWTVGGGRVLDVVSWTSGTTRWGEHADRMVRSAPDAWVVIDSSAGWNQLVAHLTSALGWDPTRTFVAAPAIAAAPAVDQGLRTVDRGGIVHLR